MGTKGASCLDGVARISWEVVEVHVGSAVAAVLHRVSDEGFCSSGMYFIDCILDLLARSASGRSNNGGVTVDYA